MASITRVAREHPRIVAGGAAFIGASTFASAVAGSILLAVGGSTLKSPIIRGAGASLMVVSFIPYALVLGAIMGPQVKKEFKELFGGRSHS